MDAATDYLPRFRMVTCLSTHPAASHGQASLKHPRRWHRSVVTVYVEPPDEERRRAPVEQYNTWPATAPPPRRLIVGLSTASFVALAANFLGSTSILLGKVKCIQATALQHDHVCIHPLTTKCRVRRRKTGKYVEVGCIVSSERAEEVFGKRV